MIDAVSLQAILFLQQLLDFHETAGAMLASQGTQRQAPAEVLWGHTFYLL